MRTLVLMFLIAVGVTAEAAAQRWTTYRNADMKVEFTYPANLVHQQCDQKYFAAGCIAFARSRRNKVLTMDDYLFRVEVKDRDLEAAIKDDSLFEKKNGKWFVDGRFGRSEAVEVRGQGLQGIYVTQSCEMEDKFGRHAAGGDCVTAFMSNGRRTVVIETLGTFSVRDSLRIIRSVRILD